MFKWPKKVNIVQFRDGMYGVRIGRFFGFRFLDLSENNINPETRRMFKCSAESYMMEDYYKVNLLETAMRGRDMYCLECLGQDIGVVV